MDYDYDMESNNFYNGLFELGWNPPWVVRNFKYAGGDKGSHKKYFDLVNKTTPLTKPPHTDRCVCGHYIKENCYITDGDGTVLVVGNKCIKRFITKSGRTCETCGGNHRNRTINKCNKCRL
jgi:hypothetical protein